MGTRGIDILRTLTPSKWEKRAKISHYASGLAGCPRKDYYNWTGAPVTNPISDSSKRKMEAGRDAHDLFNMKLQRKFGNVECEHRIEIIEEGLQYPIHGRIDNLFCIDRYKDAGRDNSPVTAEKYIIEYKSTQYGSTNAALEGPRVSHLYQLFAYMQAEDADHYYLVYEDRGSKLGCEYELAINMGGDIEGQLLYRSGDLWTPTGITWPSVVDKLIAIEEAVGSEEPPKREDPLTGDEYKVFFSKDKSKIQRTKTLKKNGKKSVHKSNWMCLDYCKYRDHCWEVS